MEERGFRAERIARGRQYLKTATASSEVFVAVKFTVCGDGQPQTQLQHCGSVFCECSPRTSLHHASVLFHYAWGHF